VSEPPFLPFHRPTITDRHVQAVGDAMRSGWLTSAGRAEEFEKAFAMEVGAAHAVAVSSCTAALHLALVGVGVGPGDEVITSPITFVSAVNVIEHMGAVPVFADVLADDLTIDPEAVRSRIGPRTRAIVATHFAGFPAHMDGIEGAARARGIPVITDAAHAIETVYHGRRSGQLGRAACYSFYATKNITTGEGGMLATDDAALAARARTLRLHGMSKDAWGRYGPAGYRHWDVEEPGWKYNMSDIQAALGLAQLADMGAWLDKRAALEGAYSESLAGGAVGLLRSVDDDIRRAHHLFVVRVPRRDRIMEDVQRRGVGVGVHFRAVHRLAHYQRKYRLPQGSLPVSERASDEVLSLPLYPSMEMADVPRVVAVLGRAVREAGAV
jgi:dTDP-4-amino-4,6-dideoxygalactose transaminase